MFSFLFFGPDRVQDDAALGVIMSFVCQQAQRCKRFSKTVTYDDMGDYFCVSVPT